MTGASPSVISSSRSSLRAGAQDARDRQHLLLAAGQPHAGARAALLQVREHRVDLVDAHAAARRPPAAAAGFPRPRGSRRCRALPGSSRCRDGRCRASACAMVSRPLTMIEPLALAGEAEDRAQRGGAAGAVAAEQRHDFAAVHDEVDAVQDVRLAVEGVQVRSRAGARRRAGTRSSCRGCCPRRCPCRPRARAGSSRPRRTCPRPGSRRARAP